MKDIKRCPFERMIYCCKEECEVWVPEIKSAFRCTLSFQDEEKCPITNVVGIPDDIELFCDSCEHYKEFKIKPVPGHCGFINMGGRK